MISFFAQLERPIIRGARVTGLVGLACSDEEMSKITGRKYENEVAFLIDVKGAKIQATHEYLDTIASAMATGDVPYRQ